MNGQSKDEAVRRVREAIESLHAPGLECIARVDAAIDAVSGLLVVSEGVAWAKDLTGRLGPMLASASPDSPGWEDQRAEMATLLGEVLRYLQSEQ